MTFDLNRYRSEFPVTESSICLNHAAVCPQPGRVRRAMCALLGDVHRFGVEHWERWLQAYETVRLAAARLLNAEVSELALTKNTSEAISFFANGLDWNPDDEVVSVEDEFLAHYYPWKAQERKGVRLATQGQQVYGPARREECSGTGLVRAARWLGREPIPPQPTRHGCGASWRGPCRAHSLQHGARDRAPA